MEYEFRDIKGDNPTKEELKSWYIKSGLDLKKFFNTSGKIYRELDLKNRLAEMSEDDQFSILATDGMLVKRPILVAKKTVLVGFKEVEWKKVIIG